MAALTAHDETKKETTFFLYGTLDFIADVEVRESAWDQWTKLSPQQQKDPANLTKRPPESLKPVTRDDRRRIDGIYNEAVRKYQYLLARKEFPITDKWLAFHFYLKTRLSESQRQTLIQAICMVMQEKKILLQARLSQERINAAVTSGTPATSSGTVTEEGPAEFQEARSTVMEDVLQQEYHV